MPLNIGTIFTRPYQSLDQDEGLPVGTPSKSKNPHRFPKVYRIEAVLAAGFAGAVVAGVLILLGLRYFDRRNAQSFVPDFPFNTPRVFEWHPEFVYGVGTKSWKTTWEDKMQPSDEGFIRIPNPSKYGLSGGFTIPNTTNTEGYSISMFHQLHCLTALRQQTFDLLNQTIHHPVKIDVMHNHHCFDYLRQAILCAGDMTLEPAKVVDGVRVQAVDGYGVTHQCRSFGAILEFAERNGAWKGMGDPE
ncbi:hypothetical protein M409DRAFT_53974 [Zasmidium cellare ATCC 36951]|uniref:Oxidase ustYa n=1 Tax=Zasmidium cellare ATCC 36951 TaxID=1080233 RepID=A0A6A6CNR0_ZASCE|nr:uncharacterized protein M409DRAFT_53974 [Zasmidium cellare ATCC 36951]KAF2167369.1 hypothetical protein M409DRAFT_53974 [Zasmidium cellare ATCC 36951]